MPVFRQALVVVALLIFSVNVFAQVASDFATNADGWTAPGALGATLNYTATGGNPDGYVSAQTPGSFIGGAGVVWFQYYLNAPAKFLGNKSSYYGGNLRFDLSQTTTGTGTAAATVILTNAAGTSIYYFPATPFQPPSFGTWTTFNVLLSSTSGEWRTGNATTAPAATTAQITTVLTALQLVQIQGLYSNANVVTRFDNITMYPPIVVSTNPASTAVCDGKTATFTAVGTNNPNITYQWQSYNPFNGAGADLTDGNNYKGTTSSTLSINTTGNFGSGYYRCKISGTAVDDKYSNAAFLTINPLPAAPVTAGDAACGPANLKLSASGGANGQYRWYTVETNGTPLAATGNSIATGTISVTTDYWVSIDNGTCESTRTKVTAVINDIPAAPGVTNGSSCGNGAVTLRATGGEPGQFRWYYDSPQLPQIQGQKNGTYTTEELSTTTNYYVSVNNGLCEGDRSLVVAEINKIPSVPSVSVDGESQSCSPTSFKLVAAGGSDGDYRWYTEPFGGTADTKNTASFETPVISVTTTFYASLSNGPCESRRSSATVTIGGPDCGITIFNAVSPNKDGKNDVFFIENIEKSNNTKSNHVAIFNRWGDLVWEGDNYDNTKVVFSGLNKNNGELPSGTYYYKIEFTSGMKMETGYIELKR